MSETIEDLAREMGLSVDEFARRVTGLKLDAAVDRLTATGDPPYEAVAASARDLGWPVRALMALITTTVDGVGALSFKLDPFTETELVAAQLTPPAIVANYLYRDLAILAAAGGTNKTTLAIWEHAHVALGRALYGLRTHPARMIFATGEDSRERIGARLYAILNAMELNNDERAAVIDSIRVLDLVGQQFRLCEMDRGGNVRISDDVLRLIDAIGPLDPGLVYFDPLASFGAPEQSVNDAAQGAVNASRRIVRDLGCCVRIVHHTGQAVARENLKDQYAPRGGSALSDGARMVAVISRPNDKEPPPFPVETGDQVFVLSRPKNSYCQPQPDIYVKRSGFLFEYSVGVPRTDAQRLSERANQIETFLIDQLKQHRYHSRNSLEAIARDLGMTRNGLRDALNELSVSGRLITKELPDYRRWGGRKTFLCTAETYLAELGGEVGAKTGGNSESTSPPSTTSPPLRKKNGGEVDAACSISPVPEPRRDVSAKCGEVVPMVRSATPLQPKQDAASGETQNAAPENNVADRNSPKPAPDKTCRGVTDQKGAISQTEAWSARI